MTPPRSGPSDSFCCAVIEHISGHSAETTHTCGLMVGRGLARQHP